MIFSMQPTGTECGRSRPDRVWNKVIEPKIMSDKHPSLKINALSNWVALGVNMFIGLLLTPAIAAHLEEKRFGMWMLVYSIIGYFGLLRLGVGTGVLRYIPMYRGKGDTGKVSSIISTAMAFYLGVGVVIAAVSWFFAGSISGFFGGGQEFARLITLMGLAAAVGCPALIFSASIRGYEGFVYVNLITIVRAIIRGLALMTCIIFGWGLVAMGWALVLVNSVGLAGDWVMFRMCCKGASIRMSAVKFADLKMLFLFGLAIILAGVADILTYSTPKMIVGKVVSLEAVGLFGVAALLVSYYRNTIYAITRVFLPRFSYLSGSNSDKEIRRLFFRGTKYAAIFAGGIAALIWTVGPSFLRLWLNESFSQATPALIVLTTGAMVLLSHRMSIDLLYGLGKQNYIAAIGLIEGIAVVGISLTLSFKYGFTGIAIGVAVPLIVVRAIFQTKYVCKLMKVGFWQYYGLCILKPWVIAVGLSVIFRVIRAGSYAGNWLSLFIVGGVIGALYATIIYFLVLEQIDRLQINRSFSAPIKYVWK